ncbi:MAG: deoxyguanosine kinase [Polaribacter sp.]|jgi:deoxyguanosine kinase
MNNPFPHRFIAIEGNIGAGKTTLCHRIHKDFNCRLVLEQFADNPFLPFFYENQERYAFPVELFFMTERHKQLQEQTQADLFQELIVTDYFFLKTLLFAKNNLNSEEYRLFQRLFHILNNSFPRPDLIVFLHRSVDNLLVNIKKRGRDYEQDITVEYLQGIQETYYDYFRTDNKTPILIIDVERLDFQNNQADYDLIIEAMKKTYRPGVNYLSFV